ncbi:hypothetical protein KM043_016402 [Ampulex compressa]|nr:hypothetical protein KM043_016402 [Ampulex compressa]
MTRKQARSISIQRRSSANIVEHVSTRHLAPASSILHGPRPAFQPAERTARAERLTTAGTSSTRSRGPKAGSKRNAFSAARGTHENAQVLLADHEGAAFDYTGRSAARPGASAEGNRTAGLRAVDLIKLRSELCSAIARLMVIRVILPKGDSAGMPLPAERSIMVMQTFVALAKITLEWIDVNSVGQMSPTGLRKIALPSN